MAPQLRPGLFYAECQDDIILLDVKQDRYFALPRALHTVFHTVFGSDVHSAQDLEQISFILQSGPGAGDGRVPLESGALLLDGRLAPSMLRPSRPLQLKAFGFRAMASIWLRMRSLEQIVVALDLRKRRLGESPVDRSLATQVASAVESMKVCFPTDDKCLAISIGLMLAMLERHICATMVMGVRTAPFSAHCWVQVDGLLVNDDIEAIGRFTPILAI